MITKNGSILWGKGRLGGKDFEDGEMRTLGGLYHGAYVSNIVGNITATSSNNYYSLVIGSGTNEPQKTDYNIQEITNQYVYKGTGSVDFDANGSVIFTRQFTNITNDDVTITELGIYLVTNFDFLLARKLIPPRVLAPGETATFSYKISFN